MSSSSAVSSVIVASVQSVGKVFVIGGVGWSSVKYPRRAPLLPHSATTPLARLCFHTLVLPLIFGTIAQAVTYQTMSDLWFVLAATVLMVLTSYFTATALGYAMNLHKELPLDFDALRISAAFPNIVALPILIFPSLCEYAVVYQSVGAEGSSDQLTQQCIATSNAMIFVSFFAWSFLFWSLGNRQLLRAANQRANNRIQQQIHQEEGEQLQQPPIEPSTCMIFWIALKQTMSSPGFIAMVLGFITGCITPLKEALFSPGGALRFLGAAIDTLGQASSSISTMVVAASLVPNETQEAPSRGQQEGEDVDESTEEMEMVPEHASTDIERESVSSVGSKNDVGGRVALVKEAPCTVAVLQDDDGHNESPIMSDPNFGTLRYRRKSSIVLQSLRRQSTKIVSSLRRSNPQMRKLHIWFTLSRLVLSPALICGILIGLECGGLLHGVPPLAKLVVVINSALPGALILVVLLKSNPALAETAAVVAKVYLTSYILSIVTLAAWTVVGLWISIPHDDGSSFCSAR